MQRIRAHINRSAGQHLRAVRSASLTADPLLLNTERLHRVDASQLTEAPVHVVHGAVEQRQCRPGLCEGLRTCNDRHCQGHPCNDPQDQDVPESERDGPLLLKVLAGYALFLLACGWSAWQLIQWLSR
jgi:hypothetical protein